MILSNNILSPQEFVEYLTGRCYCFREDNPSEEIHKILKLNGIEHEEAPLRDYPLNEILTLEAGISVVLVDVLAIDDKFEPRPEWRWFEIPPHLVEKFKANINADE